MRTLDEVKKTLEVYKPIIIERFKVREIGIFGSFVRTEQTIESDIDILVNFEKEGRTFDNYMELKYFLEECLGLKVDLVMKGALKNELKEMILSEVLYV